MSHRRLLTPLLLGLVAGLVAGCPDKKPKSPACSSDKDCKDGQRCINKKCVQCGDDDDCAEGESCRNGACTQANAECSSDDECDAGQVCKGGKCQACEANSECGPGGKCQDGECKRPKRCSADEDCADDEDCIDGRCQKPWQKDPPDNLSCQLPTVYFAFDQASVRAEEREALGAIAECIQKAPTDRGVYIVGHADDSGTEEYNIALSERRARSVADYLARLGVDPARFRVVPKGESEPSGSGPGRDRRVEFEWR